MAKDLTALRQQADTIRNEKTKNANTAERIGGMFADMLDYMDENSSGGNYKGYFQNATLLNEKYPNPANGDYAWVGEPYPGNVYDVVDGKWHDTGEKAEGGLDPSEFATKEELAAVEGKIPGVDSSLSSTSANPVQNKVIAAELKQTNENIDATDQRVTALQTQVNGLASVDSNFIGYYADSGSLPSVSSPCWALVGDLGTAKPYAYYTSGNVPSGFSAGWNDLSGKLGTYDFTVLDGYVTAKDHIDTFIPGKGTTYSSVNFHAREGRTYCIYLKSTKWATDSGTSGSLFYLGKVVSGEETQLLAVTDFSTMRDRYVFTAEATDMYKIGGRASAGTNIYFTIEDITYNGLDEGDITAFDINNSLSGILIPINEGGYIGYDGTSGVINPKSVFFTTLFLHKVVPCKKGDCFFIQAKGGSEGMLFVFTDSGYNVITYSGSDIDYSEKGYLFCAYSDGYLIVNANVTAPIKLIKIDRDKIPSRLNALPYVYLSSGFIRYKDGTRGTSSVNNRTNYIPTLGYKSMRILVNVTSSTSDTGMAFYDENREYISGIMSLKGKATGTSVAELDFPEGTSFVASTIFSSNSDDFMIEFFNRGESDNKVYTGGGMPWIDGYYADYLTGEIKSSSVNSCCEIDVKGCSLIEVTVNKARQGASPGICFYDGNGNLIKGFPYPDFGNDSATAGYVTYRFNIPAGSVKCYASFLTENKEYWKATVYTQLSSGYESVRYLSELYNSFSDGLTIVAPYMYRSEKTYTDGYSSLNGKKVSELYAMYDEMASQFPDFMVKGENLTTVGGFDIRQYELSFRHRILIDHEPAKDEVVSQNLWDENDNPKKILITCGMHGNEKTACWGAALAFKELLESDEGWANYIKTNLVLKIIPCLNPYGFENNSRATSSGYDLNRSGSENQPERLAYMAWIKQNRDAQLLIDVHGSQGRYAYVPVWAGQPFYKFVKRATAKIAAHLYADYKGFYDSIKSGFGDTYKPFVLSKYAKEGGRGNCSIEMLARFGMPEFALETPDNLIVENGGSEDESLSGLIQYNDLRNCKITKDLLINMLEIFCSVPVLNKVIPEE